MRRSPLVVALLAALLALPLGMAGAQVSDPQLPDMGSAAGELLTPAKQAEYGAMLERELRNYGYLLDDPLIDQWLSELGRRLGAASNDPKQPFTFFMLRDREINAFATLGGYVAVNSGLVLAADREDEVAAVLSHELAHVTQQHVLRAAVRAQHDQVPILLGMLAAIIAAQASHGNSSGDATMAAITSGMGLIQQKQINYTRSNEAEADRVGIYTLARAGYDVDAMADFFVKLQQAMRTNTGNDPRLQIPDYLQTHPVTLARIGEAKDRAEQIKRSRGEITGTVTTPGGQRTEKIPAAAPNYAGNALPAQNPLLPTNLKLPPSAPPSGGTGQFEWARERLRVLSANTPMQAINEYEAMRRGNGGQLDDAQEYGLALARTAAGDTAAAQQHLQALLRNDPDDLWLQLAEADAEASAGQHDAANQRYAALLQRHPLNRAVALGFAEALNKQGSQAAGQHAQTVLRPLLATSADDPIFQQAYARANELAGDPIRAGEAYAQTAFLSGRPELALVQLQNLKKRDDLDYYARSRIDARIADITPQVLDLRSQGINDPDLGKQ